MLTLQRKSVMHNFHFQDAPGILYCVRWIINYEENGKFNIDLYLYKATAANKYQDEALAHYGYPHETAYYWYIDTAVSERIMQRQLDGNSLIPMPTDKVLQP